jgi:hypothetical protein
MQQTFIVTTQTRIDTLRLQQIIVHEYESAGSHLGRALHQIAQPGYKVPSVVSLEHAFETAQNRGGVMSRDYSSKKEFRAELLSLYAQYNTPVIAFLGNLDDYDESLQEGMLKLLEEPPPNMLIVLFAPGISSLLPTIVSRAQVISLSQSLIFGLLVSTDKQRIEKIMGKAELVAKKLLTSESIQSWIDSLDLKKVERAELSFWLWMLGVCLQTFYIQPGMQSHQRRIENLLKQVTQAQIYNDANVQKKMVLYSLIAG